jgi:hypothetical protein
MEASCWDDTPAVTRFTMSPKTRTVDALMALRASDMIFDCQSPR